MGTASNIYVVGLDYLAIVVKHCSFSLTQTQDAVDSTFVNAFLMLYTLCINSILLNGENI